MMRTSPDPGEKPMFVCPHCGASLPPVDDAYCPNCQRPLDEVPGLPAAGSSAGAEVPPLPHPASAAEVPALPRSLPAPGPRPLAVTVVCLAGFAGFLGVPLVILTLPLREAGSWYVP